MKRKLLEVLRCPACRGELVLEAVQVARDAEIVDGRLACISCSRGYPVRNRVPRMILNPGPVSRTKRSFEHQWVQRLADRAEPRDIIFGQDASAAVTWMYQLAAQALGVGGPDGWCIDAGCGSAEKTREFARLASSHHVVGLDLSDTLTHSAQECTHLNNLHFVQADISCPPFAEQTFAFAMSYAVLHHTADTARAFKATAQLVRSKGTFLTWLYPQAQEYPHSAFPMLYRQRDRHFLNLARHVHPALALLWCRIYTALLFFPVILPALKRVRAFNKLSDAHAFTLGDIYDCAVFYAYDNVTPYYQHRHSKSEVFRWYEECQYQIIDFGIPALYVGLRL